MRELPNLQAKVEKMINRIIEIERDCICKNHRVKGISSLRKNAGCLTRMVVLISTVLLFQPALLQKELHAQPDFEQVESNGPAFTINKNELTNYDLWGMDADSVLYIRTEYKIGRYNLAENTWLKSIPADHIPTDTISTAVMIRNWRNFRLIQTEEGKLRS